MRYCSIKNTCQKMDFSTSCIPVMLMAAGLLLLCACSCSGGNSSSESAAQTSLHLDPNGTLMINENDTAIVTCLGFFGNDRDVALRLKLNEFYLAFGEDRPNLQIEHGNCNVDANSSTGQSCRNITVIIRGVMRLNSTLLSCYAVDKLAVQHENRTVNVTIVIVKKENKTENITEPYPDCPSYIQNNTAVTVSGAQQNGNDINDAKQDGNDINIVIICTVLGSLLVCSVAANILLSLIIIYCCRKAKRKGQASESTTVDGVACVSA